MGLLTAIKELIFGEIPEFKEGDWVQCKDDIVPNNWNNIELPVKYGEAYQVKNTITCKKCGTLHLDIGKPLAIPTLQSNCSCSNRNGISLLAGRGIYWLPSRRFTKISKKRAKELIILHEN